MRYTISLIGGWIFSSSGRTSIVDVGIPVTQGLLRAAFSLFFPTDCRVCGRPLEEVSRVPVCRSCLAEPGPMEAEHFCRACGTPFQNRFPLDEEGRCALCRNGLRGFDAVFCYGAYGGVLRRLIHLFKYGKVRSLEKPLAEFLLRALPRDREFDAIVPVPLHWRRRWRRGFNQCALLARQVSRRTGIPVVTGLRRPMASRAQAGLTLAARRHNVTTNSFSASARVAGQSILLVDDVLTTGSTATACAMALKRAGAIRVSVLTVARADRLWQVAPESRMAIGEGSAEYAQ